MIMTAMRLKIPAVVVAAGPMLTGNYSVKNDFEVVRALPGWKNNKELYSFQK